MEDLKFAKCADCKFWDRSEDIGNDFHPHGFGLCKAVEVDREDLWDGHGININERLAMATCFSEVIEGELLTRAEFSCRLFEFSGRRALT